MPRLIDADELKEHLFVGADYDKVIDDGIAKTDEEVFAFQCGWNDALKSVVQFAPTVDAVPLEDYKSMERTVNKLTKAFADAVGVVRCKDCVYCKRFNDVYQLPKLDVLICRYCCDEDEVTENDFCSWGERREDADT